MSDEYILSNQNLWPPHGRPKPPFGPTAIDVMQACPLRSCFDFSSGYERRMGTAARIGTAMHKTLQSLIEKPIEGDLAYQTIAEETTRRFLFELTTQKAEAAKHYREVNLQWDQSRIDRALQAVIAEAIRTAGNKISKETDYLRAEGEKQTVIVSSFSQRSIDLPAVEISVQSRDNLFRGRIDRAERTPEGVCLIDYKSAYRDDLPERYAKQILFYGFLWHETTGEWPIEGHIFYPLKGRLFQVPINEVASEKVIRDAEELYHRLEKHPNPIELAVPGDNCKVCDYRPWCKVFWNWQASDKVLVIAKEKAALGLEGYLESISLFDYYWRLKINWRNVKIRLVVPEERFPHLKNAKVGQLLRIIDAPLKGALTQPSIQILDSTEIFMIS